MRLRVRIPLAPAAPEHERRAELVGAALAEPGVELESDVRRELGLLFQHDLGRIRIHTGPAADAAARALGARAATVGGDILFAAGEYRPATLDGRRLLAHEVAHALQAPDAPSPVALLAPLERDEAASEHAARESAARVTSGRALPAASLHRLPVGAPPIHRFLAGIPLRESAAPLADPFVELVALDIARALERDTADASGRIRRRLARLAEPLRATVVSRVQELLMPAQREQAAEALTGAALGEEHPTPSEAPTARAAEPSPEEPAREEPQAEAELPVVAGPAEPEAEAAPVPAEAPVAAAAGAEAAAAPVAVEAEAEPREPEPTAEAEAAEPAVLAGAGAAEAAAVAAEAEAGRAASPGETGPGGAAVEPDLAPIGELEARVAEEERRDEAAAREAAEEAPPVVVAEPTAAEPAAEAPPPPVVEPAPAVEAEPGVPEPVEARPPAEAGTPPARELEPEPEPGAEPPAAEPAAEPEAGAAEPPLTREELALAAEPQPPTTPEVEAAVAEAEAQPQAEPAAAAPAAASVPTETQVELEPRTAPAAPETAVPAGTAAVETVAEERAVEPEQPPEAEAAPAEAMAAGAQATGDCGPDVGGGGSGGPTIEEPAPAAVPEVSAAEPACAMGAIASLPPAELGVALTGVGAVATRSVTSDRDRLAAEPPSLERPSGSPETRPAGAANATAAASAVTAAPGPLERAGPAATPAATTVAPLPPAPAPPTQGVAAPAVAGGQQREVTAADAQALRASLGSLPVTDPALALDAGPVPTVALTAEADPQQAADRRAQLEQRAGEAHERARTEAGRPLGEGDIYPDVPPETLTAEVPAGVSAAAPAALEAPDQATAVVARAEHAAEVRAAATEAQGRMAADREQHDRQVAEGRAQAQQEMDEQVRANAEEQAARRRETQTQVADQRGRWSEQQESAVREGRTDADAESRRAATGVETERSGADRQAAGHVGRGNAQADTARRAAERDAHAERDRGRRESTGALGWLADRARGFFDAIRRGLQQIFEAARAVVRRAIQEAQRLANEVIDAARRRIVSLIREVGERLAAIGDRLLTAFPALRDRFRAAIQRLVSAAAAVVNRLANALKEGIRLALNALGTLLEGYLRLLERVHMAAVEAVADAVRSAIRAAQAVVQAIGAFAQLIADVAANPIGWLRNLGASVVDGLRNHVWRVLKCHVKAWFNSKVEEVLGLARMIFDLLRRGGIRFAEIGRMVWEALKASLPGIAIQLAIEKLVSLLVPAASALMLIIDGLRAAWGAMSRIIAAFEAFFRFLKAVKGGSAGRQFAEALAAGAVALIDFLSNFLVLRLRRPAGGVAGRLGALARRIGATAGRVAGAVARGARRVVTAVRTVARRAVAGVRAVGRRVVAGVRAVGRRVVAGARALAGRFPRVAAALRNARAAWQRARDRFRRWREQRRQRRRASAQQRLQRAIAALRPSISALLRRGVSGLWLRGRLALWRLTYRLSVLRLSRRNDMSIAFEAAANPRQEFMEGKMPRGEALRRLVRRAVGELLQAPEVRQAAREQLSQPARPTAESAEVPIHVRPGAGFPGMVVAQRWLRIAAGRGGAEFGWGRHITFAPDAAVWFMQQSVRRPGGRVNLPALGGRAPTLIPPDVRRLHRRRPGLAPPPPSVLPAVTDRDRYRGIAREIGRIPGTEPALARDYSRFVRTGELAPHLEPHRQYLTGLGTLMFGIESQRAPMNLATAAMTTRLMERGQMGFGEAFAGHEPGGVAGARAGGGGRFPMSMTGAEAAAAELEREHRGALGPRTEAAQELARREIHVAERWLISEMLAEGLNGFVDEAKAYQFICRKLLDFYLGHIRQARR